MSAPPTPERGVGRRGFILGSLATVALAACRGGDAERASTSSEAPSTTTPTTPAPTPASAPPSTVPATAAGPVLPGDPFTLGVASGDPTEAAVILWTRLAPRPLGGGGMAADDVEVTWEVAADVGLEHVVASGTAVASSDHAHTVHVDATGLQPATPYWYRFRAGGFTSPVGRTRTMPAPDEAQELVLGHASCQHYETGFYAAHRDIAGADLHALVWLGDYIYEGPARPVDGVGVVRSHDGPEPTDLTGYRDRYALYKQDPDLQAAQAACPWFVIWDDHEVENNYAGDQSADGGVAQSSFGARRAAAYQAWWEHQPVRLPPPDAAGEYRTYRSFALGSLASLFLLDGRQYRTDQACGDRTLDLAPACAEVLAPGRTMLGDEQERWLLDGLAASGSAWNVLGNQTIMADLTFNDAVLNYDQWDGYPDARQRLLYGIDQVGLVNVVALTGDIHLAGATDLAVEDENGRHLVGTELIATSISTPAGLPPAADVLLPQFESVRYADASRRGWIRSVITPTGWEAEYRFVEDATRADSPVEAGARFRIGPAEPGAVRLDR